MKLYQKFLSIAVVSALTLTSAQAKEKTVVERTNTVEAFNQISIDGECIVKFVKGEKSEVNIDADDKALQKMQLTSVKGLLTIKSKASLKDTQTIKITITSPSDFTSLKLSDRVDFKMDTAPRCETFTVEAKDMSHASINGIEALTTNIEAKGNSRIDVQGVVKGTKCTAKASGTSSVEISNVMTKDGDFKIDGTSTMTLPTVYGEDVDFEVGGSGVMTVSSLSGSDFDLEVADAGSLTLSSVNAKDIDIKASGTGRISATVNQSETISAKTDGAGNITLEGRQPNKLSTESKGVGKIDTSRLN